MSLARTDAALRESALIDEAIELLEKANASLEPELLRRADAHELMAAYARAERLASFGVAALTRKLDDEAEVARVTGTSLGRAKTTIATGRVLQASDELNNAMQQGAVSLDQAAEIASAEESAPGVATDLLAVAETESFHVLREKARKAKLEAEQHRDLFARQHSARHARSHTDELGMVDIRLRFEPHIGAPIVARAEADAERLAKAARKAGTTAPFEHHLADAYAALLSGQGKGRARRPELVVVVSHEIAKRGWRDVREGEVCKIPGIGPVSPEVAKGFAADAFLSGVLFDGTDLRQLKRWTRNTPPEVALALELGDPPCFDGVVCTDCGNRFRTEFDHVQPHVARGPASTDNLEPRCRPCHHAKTERDRRNGKFKPPET